MKTLYSFITLCFSILYFSQIIPVENTSEGRLEPFYKYQGYLYCKHFSNSNLLDGLYKIGFADKKMTKISLDEDILPRYALSDVDINPTSYDKYIFLMAGSQDILKLDIENNTLSKLKNINSIGHVHGHILYSDKNKIFDLTNGAIQDFHNEEILNFGNPAAIEKDENFIFYSFRQPNEQKVYKMNSNGNEGFIYSSANNLFLQGFSPTMRPLLVNNRLIYHLESNIPNSSKMISVDINGNSNNENFSQGFLLNNIGNAMSYIQTNDGIIFYDYNSKKYYKSNAIDNLVEKTDVPTGSGYFSLNGEFQGPNNDNFYYYYRGGSLGASFVNTPNYTYFLTTDANPYVYKLYKLTNINTTPELVKTFSVQPIFALNWQGNLIYYDQSDKKIYKYDGTTLSVDPELNARSANGKMLSDYTITGLIADGDRLLINTSESGMFVLDKTLATQEAETSKIMMYPNPVKDVLNFNEELSDIKIFDTSGKMLKQFSNVQKFIDVKNLAKGIYFINAKTKSGKEIRQKFIKE